LIPAPGEPYAVHGLGVGDGNGNGAPDIVTSSKKGVCVFQQ
jgi:hypothetical protein